MEPNLPREIQIIQKYGLIHENGAWYSIKTTTFNEPYWCIVNDYSKSKLNGVQLSKREWDINEVWLGDSNSTIKLIIHGLEIINAWQSQMEHQWPLIFFDILLSVDNGEETIMPNVTLRFWAVRNGYHYVEPKKHELNKFKTNAVLLKPINYSLKAD